MLRDESGSKHHTIVVPVGTSLLGLRTLEETGLSVHIRAGDSCFEDFRYDILNSGDPSGQPGSSIPWQCWREHACDSLKRFYDEYHRKICPAREIGRRDGKKEPPLSQHKPDLLSAELASLYLFFDRHSGPSGTASDELVLLASDTGEGLYCACFLAEYLTRKPPYNEYVRDVRVERIARLVGAESRAFENEGMNNLVSIAQRLLRQSQEHNREVYLNITGGYKGVLPYLVLLGQALGRIRAFYLFEMSPDIVFLPELPIGFDLLTWRDYRGFINSIEHIPGLDKQTLLSLVPSSIAQLFERRPAGGFSLSSLGTVLHGKYQESKGREISEYGRGYLLVDHIGAGTKKKALKDCIDRWQHLWLGDLIPETVEHARGHAQRDLELLSQILHPILMREGKESFFAEKGDASLLALIASVWLHDLGHSGDFLQCEISNGRLHDGTQITRDIRGFPSLVRDLHHLLSWYLVGKYRDDLFATRCGIEWRRNWRVFSDELVEAIRQICLYHRGSMPAVRGDLAYGHAGIKVEHCLQDLSPDVVDAPLLGALLRMADGGDIQRERAISDEYEGMRILQNKREIERLEKTENEFREMARAVSGSGSWPPYLKRALKDVDSYFSSSCAKCFLIDGEFERIAGKNSRETTKLRELESRSQREYADTYLDWLIDGCAQKFVQGEGLAGLADEQKLILKNWLGAASQYMFKLRQPEHFKKHKGISAVMYLPDRIDSDAEKNVYRFRVLVTYTNATSREDAEQLLDDEIFKEYGRVQSILARNRIYFERCRSEVRLEDNRSQS